MEPKQPEPTPSGFDALAEAARLDPRMGNTEKIFTDEQVAALLEELKLFRINASRGDRPMAWALLAQQVGIPASTLSELKSGRYQSSGRDGFLRLVDEFLAKERMRAGQIGRDFAAVNVTGLINGVVNAGIRHCSMPVIIGPSGCGKSATARAIAIDREGVLLIRVDELNGDAAASPSSSLTPCGCRR